MGDINAKITHNTKDEHQPTSRNGKLLNRMMKQTGTTINNKPNHVGTWTRENRSKTNEKSIIDYIIIDKKETTNIIESFTDNDNIYPIQGQNRTDHNIITATININQEIKNKRTTRWKKGKTDEWTKYNDIFEETWNKIPHKKNYQHLEQTIINAMEKSIGKITINNNKKTKQKHKRRNKKTLKA